MAGRRDKGGAVEPIKIQYLITLRDREPVVIDLQFDADTISAPLVTATDLPEWTRLEYHQCPHCPLAREEHPRCPVAARIAGVVSEFDDVASFEEVEIQVFSAERKMFRATTAQRAISSLFGLLIATSECPHTGFLKPMARFHLPFASQEETIYRATGMYLLAQYFLGKAGHTPDFEFKGLQLLYEHLHTVNLGIADRLRSWTREDSSVNAIVVLDVLASILPLAIEEELKRVEKLFAPYLTEFYRAHIAERLDR